jgi:hypothetical protein
LACRLITEIWAQHLRVAVHLGNVGPDRALWMVGTIFSPIQIPLVPQVAGDGFKSLLEVTHAD